jgi:hypothetical protein
MLVVGYWISEQNLIKCNDGVGQPSHPLPSPLSVPGIRLASNLPPVPLRVSLSILSGFSGFSVDFSGSSRHISLLLREAGAKRKGYGLEYLDPASRSLLGDNYYFITQSIL